MGYWHGRRGYNIPVNLCGLCGEPLSQLGPYAIQGNAIYRTTVQDNRGEHHYGCWTMRAAMHAHVDWEQDHPLDGGELKPVAFPALDKPETPNGEPSEPA